MQAMQDRDVLVAVDAIKAIAVDLVAGCLHMFLADFSLPKLVGFHHHHLPMGVVFLPVEEFKEDINEALPSLLVISPLVDSRVDLHRARHSTVPLPAHLDRQMYSNSRV
jgi:hypothetical protein